MSSTQERTAGTLLTVAECAAELRCSKVTIYRAVAAGELEAWRLRGEDGPLRIRAEALDEFLTPAAHIAQLRELAVQADRSLSAEVRKEVREHVERSATRDAS